MWTDQHSPRRVTDVHHTKAADSSNTHNTPEGDEEMVISITIRARFLECDPQPPRSSAQLTGLIKDNNALRGLAKLRLLRARVVANSVLLAVAARGS